jgi:hypothetical protein
MYQNLMFGVKRRILREVENAFLNHPAFSDKVTVTNKFPYEQRLQYGVVLRNTSASLMRMSADNYMADLFSHVRLARKGNSPGLSVEWVRENTSEITKCIVNESLSTQVDPTNRLFFTANPIVSGEGDTQYANDVNMIAVKINGVPVQVESINGKNKKIILANCPHSGDTVTVSYWSRSLVPPGLYFLTFTEDNEFFVEPIYVIEDEVLFEKTTGLETTVTFAHPSVYALTEQIFLGYTRKEPVVIMVRGTDYSINNTTGEVTFLQPVSPGFRMSVNYRYIVPAILPRGPFTFNQYQENHEAIPGVVICIGKRAKKDDRQIVVVTQFRESQASIYGGHWDMSLSLGVISKDSRQMEEMTDQIVNWLWGVRKNLMEFEGITLNRVEPTGESEETFIETTNDLYFESSIDLSVMTEWQRFIPHMLTIEHFSMDIEIVPDTRPVIKYPTIGYERVI